MVKFCVDKYPMGSWKGQVTPGKFMDGYLYKNLGLLANKISDDMTFMGIIYSSTLEVGTGKSVLATQIGEAWTEMINKKYNLNLEFSVRNLVWNPKDLIERSYELYDGGKGRYSCIVLDEWEDATYWSDLGVTLRQFFRKCRQMNLFMICIIPNWFQLPIGYAVSRSLFAIDVRFSDKLERGNFYYYNFPAKRALYINGKRTYNYKAWKPTFYGKFPDGYGVDEVQYRKEKYEDMVKQEAANPETTHRVGIRKAYGSKVFGKLKEKFPKMTYEELSSLLCVSKQTLSDWIKVDVGETQGSQEKVYNKELPLSNKKKEIVVDEAELVEYDNRVNLDEGYNGKEEQTTSD